MLVFRLHSTQMLSNLFLSKQFNKTLRFLWFRGRGKVNITPQPRSLLVEFRSFRNVFFFKNWIQIPQLFVISVLEPCFGDTKKCVRTQVPDDIFKHFSFFQKALRIDVYEYCSFIVVSENAVGVFEDYRRTGLVSTSQESSSLYLSWIV